MPAGLDAVAVALGLSILGIFAYLLYLHILERRVSREVETLKEALDDAGGG